MALICLMISDIDHLLMCLFTICISSLKKCHFKCFAHSSVGLLFFFYLLDYRWFLKIYSGYKPFITYMIYKHFLPFCSLSFRFLDGDLRSRRVLNFDKVQFICFLPKSLVHFLMLDLRRLYLTQGHKDLL